MADTNNQGSYARTSCGPRPVDTSTGRDKPARNSRRRPSKDDTPRSSKKDNPTSPRRKSSSRRTTEPLAERPYFQLNIIGQPQRSIALGQTIDSSVLVSLRFPAGTPAPNALAAATDTSTLFAVCSLLTENRSGDRVPLEPGLLTGQKLFDSVHSVPNDYAVRAAGQEPCRVVLGYFSFPELLIRQAGTYRIRTTLLQMGAGGNSGGQSVLAVDSEPVKVERRVEGAPRRVQRAYS
ncbi:hypothetical protein LTR62_000755 [Meristemomyces frigidus]|uniref:Velvet domain-containing protein n=1 Tax=Meristemomyces frigidus TaxID=1508187 RepID=A0AAN7YSQ7_9PEZI|nr:hypothetical protein LTR62_000755 [Meristemomyces frigidus]